MSEDQKRGATAAAPPPGPAVPTTPAAAAAKASETSTGASAPGSSSAAAKAPEPSAAAKTPETPAAAKPSATPLAAKIPETPVAAKAPEIPAAAKAPATALAAKTPEAPAPAKTPEMPAAATASAAPFAAKTPETPAPAKAPEMPAAAKASATPFAAKPSDTPAASKPSETPAAGKAPVTPVAGPPPAAAVRPSRVLPWAALVVGLAGLGVGVLAIAGPRAVNFAEQRFAGASWVPPLRQVLTPGWSVEPGEFDRRVNVLEGILGRAAPGTVSRQDVVELLRGRLDVSQAAELRSTQARLAQDVGELGRQVQEGRAQAEARSSALASRIDGVDQRVGAAETALKERLDAGDQSLAKATAAMDELRAQISGFAERVAKAETEGAGLARRLDEAAAGLGKRLEDTSAAAAKRTDEIASGLDELKRRAAGPERLLVAVLQLQISAQTGRPFVNELRLARQIIGPDPALAPPLDSLTVAAQRGAPTLADLRDRFGQVADAIINRGLRENRNWAERVGAGFKGTLASVGLTLPPPPTPVEAAVAETARQVVNGNLRAALAEIETIDGPLKSLAGAWIAQAQLRIAVDQAVADITQAALDRASKAP